MPCGIFQGWQSHGCKLDAQILYMSYGLNCLKWVIWGILQVSIIGLAKGDTRSLDYSSHEAPPNLSKSSTDTGVDTWSMNPQP